MDFNRETFKKRQNIKEAKVNAKKTNIGQMKEITMKGCIETHDIDVKTNKIAEHLIKLHPVRVVVNSTPKILRAKPDCMKDVSSRILSSLGEKEPRILFSISSQTTQKSVLEIMLMPLRPK
jgi:translation initiation factor IF-3